MIRIGTQTWSLGVSVGVLAVLLMAGVSRADVGGGVFEGFVRHIGRQVIRDKVDFVATESCTSWFYQQLKKPRRGRADVYRLSFTNESPDADACAGRYHGINEAREAFAQSQSVLSLSLTFYQLALVADRNDDGRYDVVELRDILESLNVSPFAFEFEGGRPIRSLARLTGAFDDARATMEFTVLTDSMQTLYHKGYRLTNTDQAEMGRVTGTP